MGISRCGEPESISLAMTAETGPYRIHGLVVDSDIDLDVERVHANHIDARVRHQSANEVELDPGDSAIVAEFVTADRRWWTATESENGYLLRFHDTCDVFIDSQLRSLTYRPAPSRGLEVVPLLVSGTGLSLLLGLRGSLVLHASGVQLRDRAVAFAGLPGMGKSTVAGLLCAAGGRLVSDDALRVETDGTASCFRGTSQVRLRRAASSVVDLFPGAEPGTSPDDRLTIKPMQSDAECPLSALMIPHPSKGATRVATRRLSPAEAVFQLSPFLRIASWRRPDLIRQHFLMLGELARRVPVLVLTVPWVTPFTHELATGLLASVEQVLGETRAHSD